METSKVKIHFKAKPTSETMLLIMAVISFGYKIESRLKLSQESLNMASPEFQKRWPAVMKKNPDRYKPVKVSTGLSLPKEFWDNANKKAKGKFSNYNKLIEDFETNIRLLFDSMPKDNLTNEVFKAAIQKHLKKRNDGKKSFDISSDKKPFYKFIVDEISEEKRMAKVLRINENSLLQHNTFANTFEMYNPKITVDMITEEIAIDFFSWLLTHNGKYSDETINTRKKSFKKYLRIAIKKKVNPLSNTDVENMQILIKYKAKEKPVIFLTVVELDKLQNAPLKKLTDAHRKVRDLFVVASWCGGKRFGDYSKMKLIQNGGGRYYLEDTSNKTGIYTKVPAFKRVVSIWKQYKNSFPLPPSNFNKKLKEVIQSIGIEKRITSHCARRSFCSNMVFHYKMNPFQVMTYSGHKSISEFQKYIGLNREELYKQFDTMLQAINE